MGIARRSSSSSFSESLSFRWPSLSRAGAERPRHRSPAGSPIRNRRSSSGATVVARHLETGTEYRTVTTSTGDYTIGSLPARSYDLTIEAPGFKTFVAAASVQVAQTTRVDAGPRDRHDRQRS